MELLMQMEYWHWWVLALLLLIFEVLGAAGFMLGAVVAAIATGLLALVMPLGWEPQVTMFALLAIIFTVVYWKRFKRFNQKTDKQDLNTIDARIKGKFAEVVQVISVDQVKIKIGDTLWTARTDQPLNPGDAVVVDRVENQIPHVTAR